MSRPLMQQGIVQLEQLFAQAKSDLKTLKQLEYELSHRQVPRAIALLAAVQAAMNGATSPLPPVASPVQHPATASFFPAQQPSLWQPPPFTPVAANSVSAPPRPVAPTNPMSDAVAMVKPSAPSASLMPIEDAYKVLNATASSTWESIEQTRRQLVQQSNPERLKSLSTERRTQKLAEANRVNAAYAVLSQLRCGGR